MTEGGLRPARNDNATTLVAMRVGAEEPVFGEEREVVEIDLVIAGQRGILRNVPLIVYNTLIEDYEPLIATVCIILEVS